MSFWDSPSLLPPLAHKRKVGVVLSSIVLPFSIVSRCKKKKIVLKSTTGKKTKMLGVKADSRGREPFCRPLLLGFYISASPSPFVLIGIADFHYTIDLTLFLDYSCFRAIQLAVFVSGAESYLLLSLSPCSCISNTFIVPFCPFLSFSVLVA